MNFCVNKRNRKPISDIRNLFLQTFEKEYKFENKEIVVDTFTSCILRYQLYTNVTTLILIFDFNKKKTKKNEKEQSLFL